MATFVPRFLDQLRNRIRIRRYSIRTEGAYVDWARRTFVRLCGMRTEREVLAQRIDALHELMQSDGPVGKQPIVFVAPAPY